MQFRCILIWRTGAVCLIAAGCATVAKADAQPAFGCAGKAIIGSFDTSGGDGGPAAAAQLFNPGQMALDAHGNVYIVDLSNEKVRMVSPAGIISTVAGNGIAASSGDGGPAAQASLNRPGGVAVDGAGNVYVSESNGNRIRKISAGGMISTYAGNGRIGFSGDLPPASAAMFAGPADLVVDPQGNLFVYDSGNNRVRRISPDGTITTVVGSDNCCGLPINGMPGTSIDFRGGSLAIAANGNLIISTRGVVAYLDSSGILHDITSESSSTPPTEGANALQVGMNADAIATAPDGGMLVVVSPSSLFPSANSIWEVKPNGLLHQIVSTESFGPINRIVAGPGNSVLASIGNSVYSFSASGQPTLFSGVPTTGFAGDGEPAATAALSGIGGLAVDQKGNVYISDTSNFRIRRVTPDGTISTFAGTGGFQSSGDGGPASQAQIALPAALAFDPIGDLFLIESGGSAGGMVVRKIATDGTITHFAGSTTSGLFCSNPRSYCPPASGKAVDAFFDALSVVSDSKGQIYLLDILAQVILKVDLEGNISTFAQLQDIFGAEVPSQLQVDRSDNLYWIDPFSGYSVVISPEGNVQNHPVWAFASGFAIDARGNLDFAEEGDGKILKQSSAGAVSTLFDTVVSPYPSDFNENLFPLTLDSAGNLYFGDQARNRLFEIPNASSCEGAQRPLTNNVFNAASYGSGVAPGELVTFFGFFLGPAQGVGPSIVAGNRFDTEAGGVRVLFDGVPAPVLYASVDQVSAVVPFGVAGQSETEVVVEANGGGSDPLYASVSDALPGIFTRDSSGQGQAAAQNQDSTPNGPSHPAPKGSTIVIFATGAGATNPASVDGVIAGASPPKPVLPVTATVGGQPAHVAYAGGAPFEVNGILQVNIVIPASAQSGPAIPLVIQVGTAQSQSGVTVAIQ